MEVFLPLLLTLPPAAGAMIAVSLGIGVSFVGIMFMAAYALQNPQLIALAREELAALIFTIFILVFWLGSDSILNGITSGVLTSSMPLSMQSLVNTNPCSGGAGPGCLSGLNGNHINLAMATLTIVEQKLRSQYADLYLFEALIGFLSTISFPLGSPVPAVNIISFSLAPFTGLTLLSNAHTVVVEAIGYLITVLWAKEFILLFARDVVPLMLFPLGLVMRAFPFFRRTGSSIIAISFAMYFVMPFAIILSNYLVFDMFKPVDFTYNPAASSYFGSRDQSTSQNQIQEGQEGAAAHHLLDQFTSPSVVEQSFDNASDACAGNPIVHLFCSAKNVVGSAIGAIAGFVSTVWSMWRFMVGMTGDFFYTAFNNPLMPSSASAGLFYFVVQEVGVISPFVILITLTTVIEIIMTVTTYRSISLLIGGEAELIGLAKVV